MVQFGRYLTYSLLATLAGLPVGALAGSLIFGLYGHLESASAQGLWPSLAAALGFSVPAVLIGLVPALLWGAPAYAALAAQGRASWLGAVVVGVAPGALTLAVAHEWGTVLIMFGAPVAVATHLFARNRVRGLRSSGPNHSSKRTREKPRALNSSVRRHMMNLRAVLGTSACVCLISACAYWPSYPSLDRSPNVDFTSITRQTGWKHCKVSVVLTKAEVLKAAKYYGNPHPKKETGWGSLVAAISPGDQLRQVSCFETGSSGNTAGDIFYGLFRGGKLVAQMHTIIIN